MQRAYILYVVKLNMCTEPANGRTRMTTWVLETVGLGSFPNTPSITFQFQKESTLLCTPCIHTQNPCYVHCLHPAPILSISNSHQHLLSSLLPFSPSHSPITIQQLNAKSYMSLLSLKLSMRNYFIFIVIH